VREIDLDFHDTVFVRDAAIARCLAASLAPAPPIPSTPTPGPTPSGPP
jgi:hypothetical protein